MHPENWKAVIRGYGIGLFTHILETFRKGRLAKMAESLHAFSQSAALSCFLFQWFTFDRSIKYSRQYAFPQAHLRHRCVCFFVKHGLDGDPVIAFTVS